MLSGDKTVWQKVVESQRTPFDIVNADGNHFELLRNTHVEIIHKEILEGLQKNILQTKGSSNYWGVVMGAYGSGKTHLLKSLELWAGKNPILWIWIENYYGKSFFDFYLVRNVIDLLLRTPGFASENPSPSRLNILQEMVFPMVKKAMEKVLTSGDPEWYQKLYNWSLLDKMLIKFDEKKQKLLGTLKTPSQFAAILKDVDQEKLIHLVLNEYKDEIKPGLSDILSRFLALAFTLEPEKQQEAFQVLLEENEEEEKEKANEAAVSSYRSHLVTALCFVISQGNIVVCMVLDQFDNMYNRMKKIHLEDSSNANLQAKEEKFRIIINDIFGGLERFFNDSRNIALVLSCQESIYLELHKNLEQHISRRIQKPEYRLFAPGRDEILSLVRKRLEVYWQEYGIEAPGDFFPLEMDKLIQIIQQRRIGEILIELREEFLNQVGRWNGSLIPGSHDATTYRKRLQVLAEDSKGVASQLQDVAEHFLPHCAEGENKDCLIEYLFQYNQQRGRELQILGEIFRTLTGKEWPEKEEQKQMREELPAVREKNSLLIQQKEEYQRLLAQEQQKVRQWEDERQKDAEKISALTEENNALTLQIAQEKENISKSERELQKNRGEMANLTKESRDSKAELGQARQKIQNLEGEKSQLYKEIARLQEIIEQIKEGDLKKLQDNLAQLSREKQDLLQELHQRQQTIQNLEQAKSNLSQDLQDLGEKSQKNAGDAESKIQILEQEKIQVAQKLEQKIQKLIQEKEAFAKANTTLEENIQEKEYEIISYKKQIADLYQSLKALEQDKATISHKVWEMDQKYQEGMAVKESLEKANQDYRQKLRQKEQEIVELKEQIKNLPPGPGKPESSTRQARWYRLLRTRWVKAEPLHEYLFLQCGIDTAGIYKNEVQDMMIERLNDEEIVQFLEGCYTLTNLRELGAKQGVNVPDGITKREAIMRIYRK